MRTLVGLLSGGQRQAIAVSKGIAFAHKLVILRRAHSSSPSLHEGGNVLRLIRKLPEAGIAVILISHNLEEVISVADRAVVLRQGRKVGEVPATHENHEAIVSMIIGAQTTNNGYSAPTRREAPVNTIQNKPRRKKCPPLHQTVIKRAPYAGTRLRHSLAVAITAVAVLAPVASLASPASATAGSKLIIFTLPFRAT